MTEKDVYEHKINKLKGEVEYYKWLYEDEVSYNYELVFEIIKKLYDFNLIADSPLKEKVKSIIDAHLV